MDNRITIHEFSSLCCYDVHINIKRSDNGKVVINDVNSLRRSKDKRQIAKWEAFKTKEIYGFRPSVQIEGLKRNENFFRMSIDAWISKYDYEKAVSEYKASIT